MAVRYTVTRPNIFTLQYAEGKETALLYEECDQYYEVELTKRQVEELGQDILDLAFAMKDSE